MLIAGGHAPTGEVKRMQIPKQTISDTFGRRRFLKAAGLGAAGAMLGTAGCIAAADKGFPPAKRTTYGDAADLGDGEVTPFVSTTKKGKPTFVGVRLTADALGGLPTDEGAHLHLPLPGDSSSPYEWVGVDWNPAGHPPPNVYTVEHFDFHFYTLSEADVEAIPFGIAAYDIPDEQRPAGYITEGEGGAPARVIAPRMGEHLLDSTAPEFNDAAFTHTFIYGVYARSIDPEAPDRIAEDVPLGPGGEEIDVPVYGEGSEGELIFAEPMITKAFLEQRNEEATASIGMPEVFAEEGEYPTAYAVRYHGDEDAYTITLESFEPFDAAPE